MFSRDNQAPTAVILSPSASLRINSAKDLIPPAILIGISVLSTGRGGRLCPPSWRRRNPTPGEQGRSPLPVEEGRREVNTFSDQGNSCSHWLISLTRRFANRLPRGAQAF